MTILSDLSVSTARQQLASIVDHVRTEHEPVYLERHGKRVAALIDSDDLAHLLALAEDMTDIREAEAAREEMRQTGETPIPWDEVKADLGLL
jgi:prevent-host-death family protein